MRIVVRCSLMLLLTTLYARGKDCSWSRQFELKEPQALAGVFVDPNGMVLPGIGIQLWSGNKILRELRTNNQGEYNLGEIGPGKYRIHIKYGESDPLCAPKIKCTAKASDIDSKLKINPKNAVTVH